MDEDEPVTFDDVAEAEEGDPDEISESAEIAPDVDVPEEIEERLRDG